MAHHLHGAGRPFTLHVCAHDAASVPSAPSSPRCFHIPAEVRASNCAMCLCVSRAKADRLVLDL